MTVRTRFAPSPTGYLHVGGLRTALYAYLVARQNDGQFLLRIEDTDRERFVADGTANILKSLYWAGIIPDEGVKMDDASDPDDIAVIEEGDKGPYIQSERLEIYHKYAQELVDAGHAYYCFCTSERLAELRSKQEARKQPTGYDGKCVEIDPVEAKKRALAGEKHVIRMKMPKEGETVFNDLVRGEVRFKNALVDDQVIIKSDGFPTYHFAVVVDDHLMGITHIIRGEEWISSVPKHIQLYEYFGWEVPQMAHLPLLLNPDKSKLSKRQGDVAVGDYAAKGYLPEALLNFVAFLGWNPGGERELFTLQELVKEFSLDNVGKSGAVFNLEKLDWFNREYIRSLSDEDLAVRARPFLAADKDIAAAVKTMDKARLCRILALEKGRVTTMAELPAAIKFAFALPDYPAEMLIWKKSNKTEAKKMLVEIGELMNNFSVQHWNRAGTEALVGEWIAKNGYANGNVLWPLRVALSGQEKSPGPYEIADALGKDETLRRVNLAIDKLS